LYCPLCTTAPAPDFARIGDRRYFRCSACHLTFLAPEDRPEPEAERAHYLTHENEPGDPAYRRFLARLADPLVSHLPAGAEGLDYGCGPGPTLSRMLEEGGFRMQVYDPFFAPDDRVLRRSYDFITCTEVAEHFFAPIAELDGFDRMLRPGGWVGIMTELLLDDDGFADWRYRRDPTHVCFYRPETLRWIGDHYGWSVEFPRPGVALFRKPASVRVAPAEPVGSDGPERAEVPVVR
jgi:hypothetical protein